MKRIAILVGMIALFTLLCMSMASAAVTGCINAYTYNDTGNATNVTAGNVCINATDYDVDPTAAVNCDTWYECVADACAATEYYVGYAGDGTTTCVDTDWVATGGSDYNAADNYIINATENVSACSVTNTGKSATYDACVNEYTRQGPDGYCDGSGSLDTNDALANVSLGNVCIAGADANPNASTNCGTWSNCVAGATTADEYYVGYVVGGPDCTASGWVSANSTFTTSDGQYIRTTETVDECDVYGYAYTYTKSDIPNIVEDGLGTAGSEAVSWADVVVIALVLLFIAGLITKGLKLW